MKIYAKVGDENQQINGTKPDGSIEMSEKSPGNGYIAGPNGKWVYEKPVLQLSSLQFIALLTPDELSAIYVHAESNINVRIWIDQLIGADFIVMNDSMLLEGMAYMVYQGLLTQDRYEEVLG